LSGDEELERIKRAKIERIMREQTGLLRSGTVAELNRTNFDKAITQATLPVLIDFWAGWCAPCTIMKPVIEEMARAYSGRVLFAKVNVDENTSIAQRYGVMSIPNFVLFRGGEPIDRSIGAVGRKGLESMLNKHIS